MHGAWCRDGLTRQQQEGEEQVLHVPLNARW